MKFYAVRMGRATGIFPTWAECEAQVKGFSGADYKSFPTKPQALRWLGEGGVSQQVSAQDTPVSLLGNGSNHTPGTLGIRTRSSPVSITGASKILFKPVRPPRPRAQGTILSGLETRQENRFPTIGARFTVDQVVYVDGACKGNNQPDESRRRAGYGIWFADEDKRNRCGRLPGIQANGGSELYAICMLLHEYVETEITLHIKTDSTYARDTINKYMHRWARNGWKTSDCQPIKNKEIVQKLYDLHSRMGGRFILTWVKAHSGIHGNEMADALANQGCRMERDLFFWEKESL